MATTTQPTPDQPDTPDESVAVSVVAPAHNEATNVAPLVDEIVDAMDETSYTPYEIILVDDGSTDGTTAKIMHLAALFDQVKGIEFSRNFGQSAALMAGVRSAVGEYVVTIDADQQNDPADIPALVDGLEDGHDCVSGWRDDRDDPLTKTIPSAIQTKLAKYTGPDIHDFGCTLTAYRRDALEHVDLRGERHRYLPAQLYANGYSITERPVNHRARTNGASHYGTSRLLRGFVDLLYYLFAVRYRSRPMHFFGSAGVIMLSIGMLLGTWLLTQKYFLGGALMPNLPQLLLTVLLVLSGFGFVALGIVTELLMEIRYSDTHDYRVTRTFE